MISSDEIKEAMLRSDNNVRAAARRLGMPRSTLRDRLERIEAGHELVEQAKHPARLQLRVNNGVIVVFSDAHYWPGEPSTAHRALLGVIADFEGAGALHAVIANGDVIDGASISKYPSIGWENKPLVADELGAAQERLREIVALAGDADLIWTLGNHDMRFEMKLAQVAPEFAKLHGVHLKDHFPDWAPAWSCWINDDVVVKHRFKQGVHAVYNNAVKSGVSVVTGHLHSLKVTPHSDYRGTRFGVDTGTLADPYGEQFINYTEDNPVDWRSGFIVLTFEAGRLLWPEPCYVIEPGLVSFRGKTWRV